MHVFRQIWCWDISCVYFSSLWTVIVLVHFRLNASSPLVLSPSIFGYINLQSQRTFSISEHFVKFIFLYFQWFLFFFLESASTTSLLSHKLSTQWVSTWVMILMTDVEVNCNNLIVIPMIIELCQKFDSIQQNYTKLKYFFKKYFSKFLKKREVKSLTSHLRIKLISIEQAIARVYLN